MSRLSVKTIFQLGKLFVERFGTNHGPWKNGYFALMEAAYEVIRPFISNHLCKLQFKPVVDMKP
jgi:hypothetical protein